MPPRRVAFGPPTEESTAPPTAIPYASPNGLSREGGSAATPSTAGFDVRKLRHDGGRARSPLPPPLGSTVGEDEDEEYMPSPITSASGDGRSVDDKSDYETDSTRTEDTRTRDRNSRSAAWWDYQKSATSLTILSGCSPFQYICSHADEQKSGPMKAAVEESQLLNSTTRCATT